MGSPLNRQTLCFFSFLNKLPLSMGRALCPCILFPTICLPPPSNLPSIYNLILYLLTYTYTYTYIHIYQLRKSILYVTEHLTSMLILRVHIHTQVVQLLSKNTLLKYSLYMYKPILKLTSRRKTVRIYPPL